MQVYKIRISTEEQHRQITSSNIPYVVFLYNGNDLILQTLFS